MLEGIKEYEEKKIRAGDMKNVTIGGAIFKSVQKTCHLHILKKKITSQPMVVGERAGRETISTKFQRQEPSWGLQGVASVRLDLRERGREVGGGPRGNWSGKV